MAPVLAAIALVATHSTVRAQGAPEEVRAAAAQVLTLRGYDPAGELTTQGSGFFFGPGRIATNFHVISGAARVVVLDIAGDTVGIVEHAEAIDRRTDLVILPAAPGRTSGLRVETFFPATGDRLWTYGSPRGLTGTMSDGILSAVRDRNGRTLLQISAPISPGSSGGPVLDTGGRVIGVTVSSIQDGQNLNFAVPARELARLAARRAERLDFPIGEPRPRDRFLRGGAVSERPELPPRWERLARTASGAEQFYDRTSLRHQEDRLRVWVYTFYPETLMAGRAAFDATKALFEMRCETQRFRLNQYLLLRGERVIGSSGSVSDGDWSAVAPESIAERLLARVCPGSGDDGSYEEGSEPGSEDSDVASAAESAVDGAGDAADG